MVDTSTLVRRGAPISLAVLSVFSFIVAIISSVLVHDYNAKPEAKHDGASITGRVRFFLFVGWFSFIFSTAYVRTSYSGCKPPPPCWCRAPCTRLAAGAYG